MEITSFQPLLLTTRFEETKALFEELGFGIKHTIPDFCGDDPKRINVHMQNPDGFRLNVATSSSITQDAMGIRMNVRDFDAACALLSEHGLTPISEVCEVKFMKWVTMQAPSGFVITVIYHIREHD